MKLDTFIVCLDIGFRNTGYAVWNESKRRFVEAGVLFTRKGDFKYVRDSNLVNCRVLFESLGAIIRKYSTRLVLAEVPHGGSRNAKAATQMAMATAVTSCACSANGIELLAISPLEIKRVVTGRAGNESVSKETVIAKVKKVFGSNLLPDKKALVEHVADAMACILVYERNK